MAKKNHPPAKEQSRPIINGLTIPDCSTSKITLSRLPAGTLSHRIHDAKYRGNAFNDNPHSNARFSTLVDEYGDVIPTLYIASTFDAGLMETIFHDIPYEAEVAFVDKSKLEGKVHSTVVNKNELVLAALNTKPLRKLGIKPEHLITSDKVDYPYSRAVAVEIYSKNPEVQGLLWMSRQDNTANACVLFGTRVDASCIDVAGNARALVHEAYVEVLDLAEQIGVDIVPCN